MPTPQASRSKLTVTGGRLIHLPGRPQKTVSDLGLPDSLALPLASRRFSFSNIVVADGQEVSAGDVLATDPKNFGVPLLSPCSATAKVNTLKGHIVLERLKSVPAAARRTPPTDAKALRQHLLTRGAWQFFADAYRGFLPDPALDPTAVLISTVNIEPFCARGDVQLEERFDDFSKGLEALQKLLEYQPIYLVMPSVHTALAERLRAAIRGKAWVTLLEIPRRYGLEKPALIARRLGLRHETQRPIWFLETAGVFAVHRALVESLPVTDRIIALGGPLVNRPEHVRVPVGYPIDRLIRLGTNGIGRDQCTAINTGIFTGSLITPELQGIDAESTGITLVPKAGASPEPHACVNCNRCQKICPAGIMPQVLHKFVYQDAIEDADRLGILLCTGCGLCSYVCPSKIDVSKQLVSYQERVRKDLYGA